MKKGPWRKYTKSAVTKLKHKLFELVKKICRERMPCIMKDEGFGECGGVIQASHIKSEGAWKNLFLDPRNIFPMCYRHHIFVWHRDTTECSEWFKRRFAPIWEYLEQAKKQRIDFNNPAILNGLYAAAQQGYAEYADAYRQVYENVLK